MASVPTSRGGAKSRPPSPPCSRPRRARPRAIPKLRDAWKGQADPATRKIPNALPLSALLLHGLTLDADEGPALDLLVGVYETVDGWRRARHADADTIEVSLADVILLARRIDVAMELVRRGAGAMPTGGA